jgi:CHAD domain-containing protein
MEHTLGVGVAPSSRVAFGRDQHMLAEGGKMMTTDRTAIRRRLAVRRTAHRPPWGGWKLRHGSIVASLAATVGATVAATAAVGVGVALARAERDRRWTRTRKARDRQFALLPGERLGSGLRRIALGQFDLAIELLEADWGGVLSEHTVHETRKALKRLRALVRVLENVLGEDDYARENGALRDVGTRLAGARDAEVMVCTLDSLCQRHSKELAGRAGIAELRQALVRERERATERASRDTVARAEVLGELRTARGRAEAWTLPDEQGIEIVEPGLRRLYRQGRRRLRRVARRKGDTALAMHEWRKRVKDLRYAAEMLDRKDPDGRTLALRGKRRKRARRASDPLLRRLARRADELGELLGEEHDLVVLAERIRAEGQHGREDGARLAPRALDRPTRRALLKLIAGRRKRLRKRALREGRRLYRRGPGKFVGRVGRAYEAAAQWRQPSRHAFKAEYARS